jgi:hydroxymethylglutaryl-CoA lyase
MKPTAELAGPVGGPPLRLPASVRLVEVGLRDGLQAVFEPVLTTTAKVSVVEALIAAGVREIEAVSFAHPRILPQLADAEALMASVPRQSGVRYRGLIPNAGGARRARDCGLDSFVAVISADDEVSRRNQRRSVTELLTELAEIAAIAREAGAELIVGIACAFFAPARGPVPWAETERVLDAAVAAGARGVYLACTSGMEDPVSVGAGVAAARARHRGLEVGVHLHNRNGFAPANALAALTSGADWLEGAFGGLGGDMWFPGDPSVLGNAPTEDLVQLMDSVGVATGIDLTTYLTVVELTARLTGRASQSFVSRGGTRAQLAQAAWPSAPYDGRS